ncbi:unnamed protein product, partial [Amoebophrya sp. A25]|eukprot:GSA25T00017974001.1
MLDEAAEADHYDPLVDHEDDEVVDQTAFSFLQTASADVDSWEAMQKQLELLKMLQQSRPKRKASGVDPIRSIREHIDALLGVASSSVS